MLILNLSHELENKLTAKAAQKGCSREDLAIQIMAKNLRTSTMLTDMKEWPSFRYWPARDARVKQLWYVSYCLMMTSVQDRLTGLALREAGNLNWATTAFYYSAVHAGRLFCLACCGDYPMGHGPLATLLAPDSTAITQCNWLEEFAGERTTAVTRASLLRVIDSFARTRQSFVAFSPLLAQFKKLREDSNYEALLVAHERFHHTDEPDGSDHGVTEAFWDLAAVAERASRLAVELAINVYTEHLETAEYFRSDLAKYSVANTHFVRTHLEPSLAGKFSDSQLARKELGWIKAQLDRSMCKEADTTDVEDFLQPIWYRLFDRKRDLISKLREKIDKFGSTMAIPAE